MEILGDDGTGGYRDKNPIAPSRRDRPVCSSDAPGLLVCQVPGSLLLQPDSLEPGSMLQSCC